MTTTHPHSIPTPEPQPGGAGTIFPFYVQAPGAGDGYVELPYTLPQDSTLFLFMKEQSIDTWKKKLAWVAEHGGMVLFITHPDYMEFQNRKSKSQYPVGYYQDFLQHISDDYAGAYWPALPHEVAHFFTSTTSAASATPGRNVRMKINVYGMGYVGCVSAACLARQGHQVRGVDVQQQKVDAINAAFCPIVEPGLEELIREGVSSGRLSAGTSGDPEAKLSFVCVGTPSNQYGALSMTQVQGVAIQIGELLRQNPGVYHVISVRSTVLPGTVRKEIIPRLEEASGLTAGEDFGVCMNPEFLREGSSIDDFMEPPFTVVGELDERSGECVASVFESLNAPVHRVPVETAEMMKYVCNAFHALKVGFANEIGRVSKAAGVDGTQVMNLVCQDTKLNISPLYLRPGFAFGGSCLPKDLRALTHFARLSNLSTPILEGILPSNQVHLEHLIRMIEQSGLRRIGMLGLSFKADTDDLRESPYVALAEYLLGKGYTISIFDAEVELAKIFGTNKKHVEQAIPHVASLMSSSLEQVVDQAEVLVLGKTTPEIENALRTGSNGKLLLDVIHAPAIREMAPDRYQGICW